MKITEDFIGNETKELTKTKIATILRWWGFNPDSYSTWGNARVDMNNILSGSSSSTISDRERASSFLSKINYINDTDTVISNTLFAANEPGVWYDPSDLSTLFQDATGTTPVTAVEQPVGLMLDKSKGLVRGVELSIPTTWSAAPAGVTKDVTAGTVTFTGAQADYAAVVVTSTTIVVGRTYEITYTVSGVSGGGVKVQGAGVSMPFQTTNGAKRAIVTATTTLNFIAQSSYSGSAGVVSNISVRELPGNHASQPTATSRPVLSARVNQYLATETLATQNVTTLAAQYRLRFEGTGTITLSGTATGVYLAGSHLITCTAGTLTSTVSGSVTKADLRVANDGANLPPYQRVNTATDYDTVGFPHYLRFDGVDDGLVTPTITPGTDKAQVFAGVRKLSDAAHGTVVELGLDTSNTSNGAFCILSPASTITTGAQDFQSRGTVFSVARGVRLAPNTNILTGLGDISGDRATLRINGVQAAQNTADQGTGNYLAYPLYIGRRGGTTFPFNGRLYSLIVRFGSNLPAATIEQTEKYINGLTKAY